MKKIVRLDEYQVETRGRKADPDLLFLEETIALTLEIGQRLEPVILRSLHRSDGDLQELLMAMDAITFIRQSIIKRMEERRKND